MAVTFEIGIGDLRAELLAHTFVFRQFPNAARAIPAFGDQPGADLSHNFFIFVQSYFHIIYVRIRKRFIPPVFRKSRKQSGSAYVSESQSPLNPFSL